MCVPFFILIGINFPPITSVMLKVESGAKIAPSFGFSSININGLNVYTATLRMRQHSLKHMAFCYVLSAEEPNFAGISESAKLKKGYWYVTYRFATTSIEERSTLINMLTRAQGYVHQHEADQKLGTKTAPSFISWYWGNGSSNIIDDLPF